MRFMLSLADIEKARSIAERYYWKADADFPSVHLFDFKFLFSFNE
jgi:hypothetical protein